MTSTYSVYSVSANIHTLELTILGELNIDETISSYAQKHSEDINNADLWRVQKCIRSIRTNKIKDKFLTVITLNLNKWDSQNIWKYSEFCAVLDRIKKILGIESRSKLTRIDLKIDSEDPNFYEQHKKVASLLLADRRVLNGKIPNFWRAWDEDSLENRSIRLQKASFEIEYYNKAIESGGKDPAAARFEIRIIDRVHGIDSAPDGFRDILLELKEGIAKEPEVLAAYNDVLYKKWQTGNYKRPDWFFMQDRIAEYIFTRSQADELMARIRNETMEQGHKSMANYNTRKRKISFLTKRETSHFLRMLTSAVEKYLKN